MHERHTREQTSTDTINRHTNHQNLQDISGSKSHTQLKKIQTDFLIIIFRDIQVPWSHIRHWKNHCPLVLPGNRKEQYHPKER